MQRLMPANLSNLHLHANPFDLATDAQRATATAITHQTLADLTAAMRTHGIPVDGVGLAAVLQLYGSALACAVGHDENLAVRERMKKIRFIRENGRVKVGVRPPAWMAGMPMHGSAPVGGADDELDFADPDEIEQLYKEAQNRPRAVPTTLAVED